jgi:isopenicillin-N epimerase
MSELRRTGYQGFGSFHSENVEDLIRKSDEEYIYPELPEEFIRICTLKFPHLPTELFNKYPSQFILGSEGIDFSDWKNEFLVDFEKITFLNHGAFGSPLQVAYEAANAWRLVCERQPLYFIDRQLLPLLVATIRELAKFLDCPEKEGLVLIPNVTTGLNSVLFSQTNLGPGDAILSLDIGYVAVKKLLREAATQTGATWIELKIPLPFTSAQVLQLVKECFQANPRLKFKFALFDHITSNSGCVLPVNDLIRACRAYSESLLVCIDGAHSLGSLEISMREIKADYYLGNAHKWFCCPRGAAFLYVRNQKLRESLRSRIVSHGFGSGLVSQFIWDGARDYSSCLAILTCLNYWNYQGGLSKVIDQNHKSVLRVAQNLARVWNTELMFSEDSQSASMALVRVPKEAWSTAEDLHVGEVSSVDGKFLQDTLLYRFGIEVPVKTLAGNLYLRLSYHLYNSDEDFDKLSQAVEILTHEYTQRIKSSL